MTTASWGDLWVRITSGVVLAAVGLGAVFYGGVLFSLFIAVVCTAMLWELCKISGQGDLTAIALAAVLGAYLLFQPDTLIALLMLGVPIIGATLLASGNRGFVFAFTILITVAGLVMQYLRIDLGLYWLMWVVLIVICTDMAGYFAGRFFQGPKFWPSISPKKTWSGIVAGWISAAAIGWLFAQQNAGLLVIISALISFASQMGDIAESALKRRFGVKDSSNLIPGHGGFLDRFDAMIAACIIVGIVVIVAPDVFQAFLEGSA